MADEPRRHLFIPDTQIRPNIQTDHIDWIAQAIVDYLPDVIVVGGDWWDMHLPQQPRRTRLIADRGRAVC